jgi:hypothetical protein
MTTRAPPAVPCFLRIPAVVVLSLFGAGLGFAVIRFYPHAGGHGRISFSLAGFYPSERSLAETRRKKARPACSGWTAAFERGTPVWT